MYDVVPPRISGAVYKSEAKALVDRYVRHGGVGLGVLVPTMPSYPTAASPGT